MVDKHGIATDLAIRLGGAALLALGGWAIAGLFRLAGPPEHSATALEFLLATVGFLGLTSGAAFTATGRHVFDRVEVSERWARAGRVTRRGKPAIGPTTAAPAAAAAMAEAA